jgi:DNA-binding response OmpR family regulator
MRVLLVEDDAQMTKSIELMLESLGYSCDSVDCGEEAVTCATREKYDIVLLDVMLPKMDGYEVFEKLRAAEVTAPVLLQSALVERDKAIEGLSLGVQDYLIKPYGKLELAARIESALQRTKGAPQTSNGQKLPFEEVLEDDDGTDDARQVAQIIFQDVDKVMSCTILNQTSKGAALQPSDTANCPKRFSLKIPGGPIHHCEVCWRYRQRLGVKFLGA